MLKPSGPGRAEASRPSPEGRVLQRTRPLLSLVVPVFNEAATVGLLLDGLIALVIPGVDVELIVVESNSTDGSREIVERYAHQPRVRLVLQEAARGKGNAVREGLRHAIGDIIGIQDGDLEYRLDDYPRLVAPLLDGSADVVLGSRHVPGQPLRTLGSRRLQTKVVNAAHWAFTLLFDLVYGVRLRDPFTMYKLFRAECVEDLPLVADRFDFDWELLGKLIRRGYRPLEVSVAYSSRSFEGGKKVRFFRDPPTWVAACIRFRIARIPAARPRRPLPGQRPVDGADQRWPGMSVVGTPSEQWQMAVHGNGPGASPSDRPHDRAGGEAQYAGAGE